MFFLCAHNVVLDTQKRHFKQLSVRMELHQKCIISNFPLKGNSKYTRRRSRANVLQACQQRVELNTKFRAGYRHQTATRA